MKRKRIENPGRWLLFGVLLFLGQLSSGQGLHVSGQVKDATTGEVMPYVNVALMREADTVFMYGATTSMDGTFDIAGADSGRYLLQATFVGYQSYAQPVTLHGDLRGIDIRILQGTTLKAVEVVAEKPLYTMDGEKNMYNAKEDPSVQSGSASDALQNAPGVEVDAEGNITLRGVSSVEIWINDQPSHMNEEALKQYIKTLPANAIERIEVITNPSARYSTKGGVINIVTSQAVTRNELLCVGLYAGTMPSVSPWLSYVWANEKVDVNIYLNANLTRHNSYEDGTATLYAANGDTSRYQSHHDTTTSRNIGGYSGVNLNWKVSDRTQLSAWVGAYPYWGKNRSTVELDYLEYSPRQDLGYRYTHRNDDGLYWGGHAGGRLEHRFDSTGRKLTLSLSSNTQHNSGIGYGTFDWHAALRPSLERREDSRTGNYSVGLEADYAHPLGGGWEVDAGLSSSYGAGDRQDWLDTLSGGQYAAVAFRGYEVAEWGTDLAGYATVQKRWGGLTAKAGLRGEWCWLGSTMRYRDGDGESTAGDAFFVPVPSLHLSYQTKQFTSYSLSYTRRYDNPGKSQYNPFCRYSDYSYETGNPNLRLSYTHNLEAAWNKYFVGFGMVSLNAYLRANTDEIGTMNLAGYAPAYFPATQLVAYTRPENIGSSHTEGLEANITYRPTAMLNVRLNASVFNYGYAYEGFRDSRVSWSARLNVWAKLWGWLDVFANMRYSSPRLGLYSLSVANKGVDLGLSGDLLQRKLSVFVSVRDIFGMAEWGTNSTAPQYQTTGSSRFDSRFVMAGATWRIGKMELESKARQGAAEGATPQM